MGGKKIGACDAQIVSTPPPAGSGGKASVLYAGIVKMGHREGREVLGGVNGNTKSSPERIVESGTSIKQNGNGLSAVGHHDVVNSGSDECQIDEATSELTLQFGSQCGAPLQLDAMRESLAGDTGCSNGALAERNGGDILENGVEHTGNNHVGKDPWKQQATSAGDFNKASESSSRQQPQIVREFELHRSHDRDYRPPSLILPDATSMESDYGAQQPVPEGEEYRPPQSYLPSSLVMSPHDGRQNLLDPNAREFTPSPSPCASPSPPHILSIVQPSYHVEPSPMSFAPGMDLGRVMYSSDYNGAPVMPIYANGGPLFGHISGSPIPPWEGQHIGMGLQGGELSHHIPTGSGHHILPPMVGQHHPHLLRPFVPAPTMHSYIPSGCSPPIGSPTGSMPAFAVPPPLTGREHVSRALLLSGVPTELTDYSLKQELEQWGLVRALGLERRQEGLVTAHYYDLRHSKEALRDIQQQHLLQQQRIQQKFQQMQRQRSSGHIHNELDLDRQDIFKDSRCEDVVPPARGLIGGKAVWAQYAVPVGPAAGIDCHNQGTLVVFNLDVDMPLDELRAAFEAHGAVKELRETPAKRQHKFVEFYDVRDAARALAALDGQEIGGKRVKIEFSRPGGQARRARAQAQAVLAQQQSGSALVPYVGNRMNAAAMPGGMPGQPMYMGWGDHSMGPAQSMPGPPGHQYMWTNYQHITTGPPIAPLGTLVQQQQWNVGHGQLQPLPYQQIQGPPRPGLGVSGLVSIGGEVGHNRQYARGFNGGPCSPGSSFHGVAGFGRGNQNGNNSSRSDEPTGRRRRGGAPSTSNGSSLKMDLGCLPSNLVESGSKQSAEVSSVSSTRESPRSAKTGLTPKSSPREHAQYVFNADQAEISSEGSRTTLMIKNIPNKYSQAMLLSLLDQHCLCCNNNIVDPNEPQSGYDFVYLPIDFKNRCNLGYAFVNFTSVQATLKLYKSFHLQHWEAFNSRKVCQVAYARVQGRLALEEHFRNSRFACDTDEYLPLVFQPPRTGIVCPPPIVAAGHLAGRALLGSPRGDAQICRSSRNCDLLLEKSGEQSQRDSSASASSDQDSESSVGSGGANGVAAVAVMGHAGRRPQRAS